MITYKQSVTGGAGWKISVIGSYFRLLDGSLVNVVFYRNGAAIGTADGMDSGYWAKIPGGFDSVTLTPTVTQTIKLAVSTGETGFDSAPVINGGSVPTITNVVVLTQDINTVVLAQNAKKLSIKSQTGNVDNIWVSFSGNPLTTPYFVLGPGESWSETGILIGPAGITVTIYAPGATVGVDVITWI